MTDTKEQLIKNLQSQINLELFPSLTPKIQCSKELYLAGKGIKFKLIPYEIDAIGRIVKAEYAGSNHLFVQIFFKIDDAKKSTEIYIPFKELLRQIQHSKQKYKKKSASTQIYFKAMTQPVEIIEDNQAYFIFSKENKKYRLQAIELARALFFSNWDIMHVCFLPNALDHLCIFDGLSEIKEIFFNEQFFSEKSLSHLHHRHKISWLITNPDARKSFSSIYFKKQKSTEFELQFNFTPPKFDNCQMLFNGHWDDKDKNLFHINHIDAIDIQFFKILNDTNLYLHDEEHHSFAIKKYQLNANVHFTDRLFTCFHDSINQLVLLESYQVISIESIKLPATFLQTAHSNYSRGISSKHPFNLFFNPAKKNRGHYFQARVKFKNETINIIGIPQVYIGDFKKIKIIIFSLEIDIEEQLDRFIKGIFVDQLNNIPSNFKFFYRAIELKLSDQLANGAYAEDIDLTIKKCLILSEELNTQEEKIIQFNSMPLESRYEIVFFESITLPILLTSKNIPSRFRRKESYPDPESLHFAIGINIKGEKTLLGIWIFDAKSSEKNFWFDCLFKLKNRGLKDILFTYTNTSEPSPQDAIKIIYPNANLQERILFMKRDLYHKYYEDEAFKKIHSSLEKIHLSQSKKEAMERANKLLAWLKRYHSNDKIEFKKSIKFINFQLSNGLIRAAYLEINKDIETIINEVMDHAKNKGFYSANEYVIQKTFNIISITDKKWKTPIKQWNIALIKKFLKLNKNRNIEDEYVYLACSLEQDIETDNGLFISHRYSRVI